MRTTRRNRTARRNRASTAAAVDERPARLWSPAQLIALLLGAASIAFGALALIRTGLDVSHLTRAHHTVLGFGHTPLLALAEIGFGILMLFAALGPIAGRSLMTLLGAAAVGLGLVVVAGWWSARMTRWLGVSDRNGWLFLAVGGFAILVAFFAPVWAIGGRRVVREPVADERTTVAADDATAASAPPRRRRVWLPGTRRHDEPRVPESSSS